MYMDAMYAIRLIPEVSHRAAYMGTSKRRHTAPAAHKPSQNREFSDRTSLLGRGTSD
jgi:hypothetical protein